MGNTTKDQLENSRNNLRELGNALSNLVNSFPDVFEDPEIKSRLESFQEAHSEALQRLENPTFSIATIGTTSSGKSTIVNALIGRKIAPMEAGEMSGGVLTLQHSEDRTLSIEETEGATWETGSWSGLSDDALYDKIQKVMTTYHERRKKKNCLAPRLTASAPLLPVASPQILGLPPGVGVEILDLPGLKSTLDRDNLAVIQQQVRKAFSLVALDYGQVDEQQRKKLLQELKEVVEYSQGRTDLMIFILNRVDLRGMDDLPLDQRIEQLKGEIQEVLSLSEPPDIISFSARMLYYAQCAWGSVSLAQASSTDSETRLKFLTGMFSDCEGFITRHTKDDWDLDDWFQDIRKNVFRENLISDEQVKQVLTYALEWSGGNQLWDCIQERIKKSFAEIVIVPAVIELPNSFEALLKVLNLVADKKKIVKEKQIQEEIKNNKKSRQKLLKEVKEINEKYKDTIAGKEGIVEKLKALDPDNDSSVKEALQTLVKISGDSGKKFQELIDTVEEIEEDINLFLINPVRIAFKEKQSTDELGGELKNTPPHLVNDITKAYANVSIRLRETDNFTGESGYLTKRVSLNKAQELEHDEKYVRLLYLTMKRGITARAEFLLQAKEKVILNFLELLVKEQINRLEGCLANTAISLSNVSQAVISDLQNKVAQNKPSLPDNLFDLRADIEAKDLHEYTKGSCFKKTDTKDAEGSEEIHYKELRLPNVDLMAEQWSSGVEERKADLWNILSDGIVKRLEEIEKMSTDSIEEITNLVESVLSEQSRRIEQKLEDETERWNFFESELSAIKAFIEQLR